LFPEQEKFVMMLPSQTTSPFVLVLPASIRSELSDTRNSKAPNLTSHAPSGRTNNCTIIPGQSRHKLAGAAKTVINKYIASY
jgi:hypothetical protein